MNKHPLANCGECPLKDRPYAPMSGPQGSDVVVVSRSPSYQDGMIGRPFSGPSGKVLDFLLKQNDQTRKTVRATNVISCAPRDNDVPKKAIECCKPRLTAETADAKLVIAAGAEAVRHYLGAMSIERARGYTHTDDTGRQIVATNNPALVLRDDSTYPNLVKDFSRAFNPIPPFTPPTVEVIEDGENARRFVSGLIESGTTIAADIESRGGLTHKATLISLQFATTGSHATVLGEREGLWGDEDFIRSYIRPLFATTDCVFVWHNGSFDTKVLRHSYLAKARIDHDTLLQSYALDERPGYHSLEYLLMEMLGWPKYEDAEISAIKKTGIVTNYDKFYEYAGWDVAGTYQLHEYQMPRMEKEGVA